MPAESLGFTPVVVGLPMAAALGLMFGMGPCLISCLPFLGPVFLSTEGGIRRSARVLVPHAAGRIAGYAGLSAVAGAVGDYAGATFSPPVVNTIIGSATLLVGLGILLMARVKRQRACGARCGSGHWEDDAVKQFMPTGLFLMGLGMAFTPCAPLSVVMFSAATAASWQLGLLLGTSFGLGAIVIPTLFYGVGFSYFASQLRSHLGRWLGQMEILNGALLAAMGLVTLFR
ncbi:MAG: sulfite exporter TauE/SafE family protein [Alphaproteobacteria bacterium]|nr:sulfite exporter TauE/SafE family protein [Alphaproteobacteria bacterium]MBM3641749.1 sulfite exporter TauE/SafE family protein [Alphaproteobacteria bacterium]